MRCRASHLVPGLLPVVVSLLSACSRGQAPAAAAPATDTAVAAAPVELLPLDGMGRAMLAPLRVEIMNPEGMVKHLSLKADAVIADIGAGPGVFTHVFSRAVPRGKVIATDIQRAYLERIELEARKKAERNIEVRTVEPEATGLRDAEVDLVFLCQVDHYLRDRAGYFAGLRRALRPGGRIVVVNYLREREPIEALAQDLGWREDDRWQPAPGFFARIYRIDP